MNKFTENLKSHGHFFVRNIPLLIFILVSTWLRMTQHKFALLGEWRADPDKGGIFVAFTPIDRFGAFLDAVALSAIFLYLCQWGVHLVCNQTVGKDAESGRNKTDWDACSPEVRVRVTSNIRIGFAIALGILLANMARAEPIPVNQVQRWQSAQVNPHYNIAVDVAVGLYQRHQAQYESIQRMKKNGVPAPILFCLHYRECDNSFRESPAQGDSLQRRSVNEPRGRIPNVDPPYTFDQAAYDAYYVVEHPPLDKIDWSNMQAALDKMESFNGFGYRAKGIAAPYLWSGTSLYHGGKYVRDGVFSRTAMDQQLGCAAILNGMIAKGIKISFIH